MFRIQKLCFLILLCNVCFSFGDVNVEMDNLEQKWSTVCESVESIVPFEKYNELAKELCEKRVGLERLNLLLDASKVQNELKDAHREREKTILQDNCELRVNLAVQNATLNNECSQKLEEYDRNLKSAEAQASECSRELREFPGIVKKEDLVKLATGYYHISDKNDKANWYIASNRCKVFGLELVSIETKEENDALVKVLGASQLYWTSGTDQGSEGQFYWASTGHQIGFYRNFDIGQPNNANNSEHCLQFWNTRKEGHQWNDRACDYVSSYICEYKRL